MKTVLITGVGRGIGRALAEKFLAEGYAVVGTTQTGTADYSNPNLTILQLDLAAPESISACAQAIKASGTKMDIMINNAGIMADEDQTHVIIANLRKTLEVNLIGTIDITEQTLPLISAGGHIVTITSAAGSLTDEEYADKPSDPHHNPLYKVTRSAINPFFYPSYKISKCALNMYVSTLAQLLEHEQRDITVSAVHPGWVRTDMGGDEAPTTPAEAAENIFKLAVSRPETGQFWFNGEKYPW